MKYDFDTIIDRENDPYSYSIKWGKLDHDGKPVSGDRICFQIADMDFKCAPEIIEALKKEAEHGIFGYSIPNDAYFNAVAGFFKRRFNYIFKPTDIIPYGTGTHAAITDCILSLTKEGEGVIVLTPSYNYHRDIETNNRKFVGVDMINNDGYYTIDYNAFEIACKDSNNKLFILCHPHNPCGRVFNLEELQRMGEICKRNNVIIVSDEVHCDIVRKGIKFIPMAVACGADNVITCTAVNKTFNLAGLAVTNMIISNPKIKERFPEKWSQITPFGIAATIAAYTKCDEWVNELNMYLDDEIDYFINFMHKKMPRAKVIKPEATYIIYVDFSAYGLTDEELFNKLRNECKIVDQGGKNFDDKALNDQVRRFCLTSPKSVIIEACERLYKAFENK